MFKKINVINIIIITVLCFIIGATYCNVIDNIRNRWDGDCYYFINVNTGGRYGTSFTTDHIKYLGPNSINFTAETINPKSKKMEYSDVTLINQSLLIYKMEYKDDQK